MKIPTLSSQSTNISDIYERIFFTELYEVIEDTALRENEKLEIFKDSSGEMYEFDKLIEMTCGDRVIHEFRIGRLTDNNDLYSDKPAYLFYVQVPFSFKRRFPVWSTFSQRRDVYNDVLVYINRY